jgi:hypothetical protein
MITNIYLPRSLAETEHLLLITFNNFFLCLSLGFFLNPEMLKRSNQDPKYIIRMYMNGRNLSESI